MSSDMYVYIGTTKCGCNVAVVVDMVEHPDRTNQWLADFVRAGYTVSRHALDDYRAGSVKLTRCTHDNKAGAP